jgi:predicted nucleic-acid-binding Zn-ribbon protein
MLAAPAASLCDLRHTAQDAAAPPFASLAPVEPDPEIQRLAQALNRAGVRTKCPACGAKEAVPAERPVMLPASGKAPGGFSALAVVCKNCGYIRLHAAGVLDRFIDPRED